MGRIAKVIVAGAKNVGKTAILDRAITGADALEKVTIFSIFFNCNKGHSIFFQNNRFRFDFF